MKTFRLNDTLIKAWTNSIDDHAMREIENISQLPFVYHHLAFMPDVHGGMGMPIGGVLATRDVVIPNAVGVDIGCGMCAVKTNILADSIPVNVLRKQILSGIRACIPLGMVHHNVMQDEEFMPSGHDFEKLYVVSRQYVSARNQIGTLGGGNHFIELQRDDDGYLWIMLHSGSRNLGKQVGDYYNKVAKELNRKFYSAVQSEWQMAFIPMGTKEFEAYWDEMQYCIAFAFCNRKLMMERIKNVISDVLPDSEYEPMINIAHNYAKWEQHFGEYVIVHRKGAVRAGKGDIGIIPGSQGTCSYIVEGLGCEDSFMSSSHGAGRLMSRHEARNTLSLEAEQKLLEQRNIIHSIRSVRDLDEAASAYKDIDVVMANQTDLVKIKTKLYPIAVIKG